MTISSVAVGALILVPILIIYFQDQKQVKYKTFSMMVTYLLASIVLASFNVLVFLAIASTFVFIRTKKLVFIFLIGILGVLSAFLPTGNIALVSAFVIGIALLITTQPEIMDIITHTKKKETLIIEEDPKIKKIEALKAYYKSKIEEDERKYR
ncbi:MAG: hypothetical protein QW478_04960 [Candidatus Micrarchaeaceae archaeon]